MDICALMPNESLQILRANLPPFKLSKWNTNDSVGMKFRYIWFFPHSCYALISDTFQESRCVEVTPIRYSPTQMPSCFSIGKISIDLTICAIIASYLTFSDIQVLLSPLNKSWSALAHSTLVWTAEDVRKWYNLAVSHSGDLFDQPIHFKKGSNALSFVPETKTLREIGFQTGDTLYAWYPIYYTHPLNRKRDHWLD